MVTGPLCSSPLLGYMPLTGSTANPTWNNRTRKGLRLSSTVITLFACHVGSSVSGSVMFEDAFATGISDVTSPPSGTVTSVVIHGSQTPRKVWCIGPLGVGHVPVN